VKVLREGSGHNAGSALYRQYLPSNLFRMTDRVPLPVHDSSVPSLLFRLLNTFAQSLGGHIPKR
jgi:hypothetical protein